MRVYAMIFLSILGLLSKWNLYTVADMRMFTENEEKEKKESSMKREVCKVVETETNFILENTNGETYCLDISLKQNFKKEDDVLLIYTKRREVKKNVYEAEVYAIYENNLELQLPVQ
ncbi:MAG: hypothetical protein Q4P26_11250 [Lachnospiraceae bacterium]|nr:hypothetical protein [Lachnospiraceae bacterium]